MESSFTDNGAQAHSSDDKRKVRLRFCKLLQKAAANAVKEDDPWDPYGMDSIPAERVIQHQYDPSTRTWRVDQTIVKIQSVPFTNFSMRYFYRMKKRDQHLESVMKPGFHKIGWDYASNYSAKAYFNIMKESVDTTDIAKIAIKNDIIMQYEAQYWADQYNSLNLPTKIKFLSSYAIEFPDRPGQPWFAVEPYITSEETHRFGYMVNNNKCGYVRSEFHQSAPQAFSAFTFFASNGNRLVVDIQAVHDFYTNPIVLSQDGTFGVGDIGPRGMALFFHSFQQSPFSKLMGIPNFPLSPNEIKSQINYNEHEETFSSEFDHSQEEPTDYFDDDDDSENDEQDPLVRSIILSRFQKLDMNRMRRISIFETPPRFARSYSDEVSTTIRRSNVSDLTDLSGEEMRQSIALKTPKRQQLQRLTASDSQEVDECLRRAQADLDFTNRDRYEESNYGSSDDLQQSAIMEVDYETSCNLGRIHYQLAVLHGLGRFPETIPHNENTEQWFSQEHDAFSVLFHLSYAAALQNSDACLSLGRVLSGLGTSVSKLLKTIVPIDLDAAKVVLQRGMAMPVHTTGTSVDHHASLHAKVAAGCRLFQILHEDNKSFMKRKHRFSLRKSRDAQMIELLKELLQLLDTIEARPKEHYSRVIRRNLRKTNAERPCTSTCTDDSFVMKRHEIWYELANLYERSNQFKEAAIHYEQAANGALAEGRMQTASEWFFKRSECLDRVNETK